MLTGPALGAAIESARKLKGVTKKAMADAFGVKPPSIQDWVRYGTIDKAKLPLLWQYFGDVVGPDHWGLRSWMKNHHPSEGPQSGVLIAQEMSPPDLYPALTTTATGVPVIGTLQMGSTSKHLELRTLPDGRTLGTVEAFPTGPGQHALRVLGDDLYPAVRHGNFLIVAPGRPCVPGELVLIETAEGHYLVQELVAEDDQFVTLLPATGGMRTTLARDQIATMDPITNNVSGSTFRQP